ncbi:MAG: SCP-2 sterol transfer family protein [Lachnospiraceae bacterium]|nr:SCP-2 sterol transfer family protein [Lachnospiraceae bacterium]
MRINIYYGGRGNLDDPTLYTLKQIERVLSDDLKVEIHRYNIYEQKNHISTLPQTLKSVDGIILATTVEWLGIGGYMTQFLDACWLYGDKEKFSSIYMQPVVMSTTYGEREGALELKKAWEILGGIPCDGLCGYVEDMSTFEGNKEYLHIIEKMTENLYRTISHKMKGLPTSNQAVSRSVAKPQQLDLTPEEGEQLSEYVSDDIFVKKQRQDVMELASLFSKQMGGSLGGDDDEGEYVDDFLNHFKPSDVVVSYSLIIDGFDTPLYISVKGGDIDCHYGNESADLTGSLSSNILNQIIAGKKTFQGAFSLGNMSVRGKTDNLMLLDKLFVFDE